MPAQERFAEGLEAMRPASASVQSTPGHAVNKAMKLTNPSLRFISLFALSSFLIHCNVDPADMSGEEPTLELLEPETLEQSVIYGTNGHDYLFVQTPKTWEEARFYCQNQGYYLVTINDAGEEAFLHTQESRRIPLSDWWIGVSDRGIEGSWSWVSGTSSYSNWAPGEPNDAYGNEDCGSDNYSYNNFWNDLDCTLPRPFICERESLPGSSGSFSYSATNTNDAQQNTYAYSIYLYAGQVFTFGTCGLAGASGYGDTYLRIKNPSGAWLALNDDAGGSCGALSNLSIVAPVNGTYTIHAGCWASGSCGGTVAFSY